MFHAVGPNIPHQHSIDIGFIHDCRAELEIYLGSIVYGCLRGRIWNLGPAEQSGTGKDEQR